MKAIVFYMTVAMFLVGCGASVAPPPARPVAIAPPVADAAPTVAALPGISWQDASAHVGEVETVCGPVAGATYRPDVNGSPTWLNIGQDYPSPSRFAVIIWGEDRSNFSQGPEDTYARGEICATGTIELYQGVAQMQISSPSSLSTR